MFSLQSVRKLAKKEGIERISKKAIEKILKILEEKAIEIIKKAKRNAWFAGRQTVKSEDILNKDNQK